MILSGELPSGTKLRQVEVSERFGVSTTPVREAFTALSRDGLVQQDAHRGVTVILPRQADLLENYEIRRLLEPYATQCAAKSIDAGGLAALQRLVDAQSTEDDPQRSSTINREFHRQLYDSAERPRLAELIENLRNSAEVFLRLLSSHLTPSYQAQALREHQEIVDALRAGAAKRAAKAMEAHLAHNLSQISGLLEELVGEHQPGHGTR